MTDEDGDMVYETIQSFFDASGADQIEFKFINGNDWTDPNEFIDTPCGNEYGNRILDLDASDIVLSASGFDSPYCFNSCGPCVPPLAVTFNIDMSTASPPCLKMVYTWPGHFRAGIQVAPHSHGRRQWVVECDRGNGARHLRIQVYQRQ